ncbi:hypothetical protein NKH18_10635 [Streptomyces sp. M10(2022)]
MTGGPVLPFLFTLVLLLDLAYLIALYAVRRAERRPPDAAPARVALRTP